MYRFLPDTTNTVTAIVAVALDGRVVGGAYVVDEADQKHHHHDEHAVQPMRLTPKTRHFDYFESNSDYTRSVPSASNLEASN